MSTSIHKVFHKSFNEELFSADAPSQTTMRSRWQPVVSLQVFNELGSFVTKKSNQLPNGLLHKRKFGFVSGFSLPLTQGTDARLLKLTSGEEKEFQKTLEGYDIFHFGYPGNVETFFLQSHPFRKRIAGFI